MEKNFPYEIRWIRPGEWQETMDLIWRTFLKYEAVDYTREGIDQFHDFLYDGQLKSWYLQGAYEVMVALDHDRIIGEISVRKGNFISLLFVDEDYHRRGVGTALIERMAEYLKRQKSQVFMTVKAAPYAVDFYRRLGFHSTGPEICVAGIRVTPMEKFL